MKITFIVQSVTGSQASLTKKGSFKRSSSIKTLAQSVGMSHYTHNDKIVVLLHVVSSIMSLFSFFSQFSLQM